MTSNSQWEPRTVAALFKLDIEDALCKWDVSKPLRTGAPHASAILAPSVPWCVRQHVLAQLHPERAARPDEKPWDTLTRARFLHGWSLHEKWQDLLSRYGEVVEVEISHFDQDRQLHFTPDAIVKLFGQAYVVEIKGYKASTFEEMDEAGTPPRAAWHQCNLYMHLLQIPRGLVLVENKNTQEIKVWGIPYDPELARVYTQRCYDVKGALALARESKGLPERICESGSDRTAQACPMRHICFER